jgi:hypothetical protein
LRFAWTNLINQLDLTAFLFLESKEAVCVIQVALAGAEAPAPLIPRLYANRKQICSLERKVVSTDADLATRPPPKADAPEQDNPHSASQ